MDKGVPRLTAFLCAALALALPSAARAGEFCPARIAHVASVSGNSTAYAIRLATLSARAVTGQFLLETNAGWYRAPFPPVRTQKAARDFESPPIDVQLPKRVDLRNVWLAQAASDDPAWQPRGIVNCAPDPERHTASAAEAAQSKHVTAMPVPAPFSYSCKTPFAHAKVDPNTIFASDADDAEEVAAEVDIDASGKVVDVMAIPGSNADFTERKRFEDRVKHMRFTPAVAYCKPVPSSYILSERAP